MCPQKWVVLGLCYCEHLQNLTVMGDFGQSHVIITMVSSLCLSMYELSGVMKKVYGRKNVISKPL